MPVTITRHDFAQLESVEPDLIVNTIEKNRDRIRTSCGMLLTLAGVLISFSTALLLFIAQKTKSGYLIIIVLASAIVALILSAILAISSSFLRTEYAVSDKSQFIADLLRLYHSELRLLRLSAGAMILGLLLLLLEAASFLLSKVEVT